MKLIELTHGWKIDLETGRLGGLGMPSMMASSKNHNRAEWRKILLALYREEHASWSAQEKLTARNVIRLWGNGEKKLSHEDIVHAKRK